MGIRVNMIYFCCICCDFILYTRPNFIGLERGRKRDYSLLVRQRQSSVRPTNIRILSVPVTLYLLVFSVFIFIHPRYCCLFFHSPYICCSSVSHTLPMSCSFSLSANTHTHRAQERTICHCKGRY